MNNVKYVETQNFWTKWLFAFFILFIGIGVFKNVAQKEWGDGSIIGLSIIVLVIGYFTFAKLRTALDDTGIYVDFKPFVWNKKWSWDEIDQVQIQKYGLMDYGGWGYRIGLKGKALTVKGRYGFQIRFKDGNKILIGTQRPEEVQQFLDKMRHEQHESATRKSIC